MWTCLVETLSSSWEFMLVTGGLYIMKWSECLTGGNPIMDREKVGRHSVCWTTHCNVPWGSGTLSEGRIFESYALEGESPPVGQMSHQSRELCWCCIMATSCITSSCCNTRCKFMLHDVLQWLVDYLNIIFFICCCLMYTYIYDFWELSLKWWVLYSYCLF